MNAQDVPAERSYAQTVAARYWQQGHSIAAIARQDRVPRQAVAELMQRWGISRRTGRGGLLPYLPELPEQPRRGRRPMSLTWEMSPTCSDVAHSLRHVDGNDESSGPSGGSCVPGGG